MAQQSRAAANIAQHLIYRPDAFGTVQALGIDQYPGEMTIARELVQNADDAFDREKKIFPTYIKFVITDKELLVEHDGKPFSRPPERLLTKPNLTEKEEEELEKYDFIKLSRIGLGKVDEEMTGRFGTGFSCVFHMTDIPRVQSNGWDFEIHVGREPAINEIRADRLTFIRLPFRSFGTKLSRKIGAEVFGQEKIARFKKDILVESYKMIFFLKNIKRIEVFEDENPLYVVERTERSKKTRSLVRTAMTISVRNWKDPKWQDPKEKWFKYSLCDIPIPQGLRSLNLRRRQHVSVAISIGRSMFAEQFHVGNHSYFTFPIQETKFHFKYNASRFFTTTARSDFITKEGLQNEWNKWQLRNLARLLVMVVKDFTLASRQPGELYRFLPHHHEYLHEYDKYLIDAFREHVREKGTRFVFTTKGIWVAPKHSYIGDKRLEIVLPPSQYRHFADRKFVRYYEYESVLAFYGANILSKENLIDYLETNQKTRTFINRFGSGKRKESVDRLRTVLEYFESVDITREELVKLQDIDFILTEDNTLRSKNYGVYFPTDKDMPLIDPDDIVHHGLYASRGAKSFLKNKLAVQKMNLHHLVIDSFLQRLNSYSAKQKFRFTLYLARHKKEVEEDKGAVRELSSNLGRFLIVEWNNLQTPEVFLDDGELKLLFGNRLNYLSTSYESVLDKQVPRWRRFFTAIGVKSNPSADKVVEVAADIAAQGFSRSSAARTEGLFKFLSKRIKNYSDASGELWDRLNLHKWIPTTANCLEYPRLTYVDTTIRHLVGKGAHFVSFVVKVDDPLVGHLKMLTKASPADVINYLLQHRASGSGGKDKRVDFRIYEYLDHDAEVIGENLRAQLRDNKTVWFRGRLWSPRKLFLKSQGKEFGPNGVVRGFLHKECFAGLGKLCALLGIEEGPTQVDSYVDFLLDISERAAELDVRDWGKYIEGAHRKLAYNERLLRDAQAELLARSKIVVCGSSLVEPRKCYLVRTTETIYTERLERAGIVNVPLVIEKDAKREKYFLSLHMNEIHDSFFQRRSGEDEAMDWPGWKWKIEQLIPWINGYAYNAVGEEGISDLSLLRSLEVRCVRGLQVVCGIEYNGERIEGSQIQDFCCLEKTDRGGSLYLDATFDEKNNAHLQLLSNLMATLIDSGIAVRRVEWIMLLNQYFRQGEISGINPYNPQACENLAEAQKFVGEEEPADEGTGEETGEEGEVTGEPEHGPADIGEGEKEKDSGRKGTEFIDDGLNEAPAVEKRRVSKRKAPAPSCRGGGEVKPHAVDYACEREWVKAEADNFCQVCALFCESCSSRQQEQCPCEVRKNAESALAHHHLQPYGGDWQRDVRGNLIMLCAYHHKQLDGIDVRLGYIRGKAIVETREEDVILSVYPKNKDETEIKIKFSNSHFDEFDRYARSGAK